MFGRRIKAYSDPADLPRHRWRRWAVAAVVLPVLTLGWIALATTGRLLFGGADGASVTLRTVVFIAALAGLTLATLYAIWRVRLERLARKPGPILVFPIVDRTAPTGGSEPGPDESALARRLTGEFQRRLADTRLYKSTAIPSSGSSSEFLDVVERAGDTFSVFWTPITGLLRLLCPISAYQVRCELLPPQGEGRPPKVVRAELQRLPASSIAPALIEEDTWERAIEHAAHRVAAAILPRTRQCRTPPWTQWQHLRLPPGLFDLVQRYQAELDDHRYDEAQATLQEARSLDPGNLALRLELGKLQEKMDMHLDALLTYDDIVSSAARTSPDLASWWIRSPDGDEPWTDEGRAPGLRASHPVVHVARYRHALLLGLGDKLAAQWWDRSLGCANHRGAREQRRDYLRRILRERFLVRYRDIAAELERDGLVDLRADEYLSRRRGDQVPARERAGDDARIFFTTVAVAELEVLVTERRHPRWRPAPKGQRQVLPRRSLELALVWACLRRGMAFVHAGRSDVGGRPGVRRSFRSVRRSHWYLAVRGFTRKPDWPPDTSQVDRVVRRILRSRRGTLRSWHEHYNAACVYALLLLPADPFRATEQVPARSVVDASRITRLAVGELSKAAACSDSGYLASQRDWLLDVDPDLDQLRSRLEFRDFEAQTFGSVGRSHQRGPRMGIWQQSAHVADIISSSGRRMADLWERRSRDVRVEMPPLPELRGWVDEEREGWRLAEELAEDNRDWATRHRVGRRISAWAVGAGIDLSRRPHPVYSEARLARQRSSMEGKSVVVPIDPEVIPAHTIPSRLKQAMEDGDARLRALAIEVRSTQPPDSEICCARQRPLVLVDEWDGLAARFDDATATPTEDFVVGWCRRSRDRWRALSVWFDDSTLGVGDLASRREEFRRTMTSRA